MTGGGSWWSWGPIFNIMLWSQRRQEILAQDEVTEVGDVRVYLYAIALTACMCTLTPIPLGVWGVHMGTLSGR